MNEYKPIGTRVIEYKKRWFERWRFWPEDTVFTVSFLQKDSELKIRLLRGENLYHACTHTISHNFTGDRNNAVELLDTMLQMKLPWGLMLWRDVLGAFVKEHKRKASD